MIFSFSPYLLQLLEKYKLAERVIVCAVEPAINQLLVRAIPDNVALLPDIFTVMKRIVAYAFFLDWLLPWNHPIMGCVAIDFTKQARSRTPSLTSFLLTLRSC